MLAFPRGYTGRDLISEYAEFLQSSDTISGSHCCGKIAAAAELLLRKEYNECFTRDQDLCTARFRAPVYALLSGKLQ
jgi:hypothetical protein